MTNELKNITPEKPTNREEYFVAGCQEKTLLLPKYENYLHDIVISISHKLAIDLS